MNQIVESEKTALNEAVFKSRAPALYREELSRFQELLKEDRTYAYQRAGLSLLYGLPPALMVEELGRFGWKPRAAVDFFSLGAIKTQAGDHQMALEYYKKAVELDPAHWSSYANMALTYAQMNEKAKARSAMENCVRILENKPELYPWEKADLENARKFLEEL